MSEISDLAKAIQQSPNIPQAFVQLKQDPETQRLAAAILANPLYTVLMEMLINDTDEFEKDQSPNWDNVLLMRGARGMLYRIQSELESLANRLEGAKEPVEDKP